MVYAIAPNGLGVVPNAANGLGVVGAPYGMAPKAPNGDGAGAGPGPKRPYMPKYGIVVVGGICGTPGIMVGAYGPKIGFGPSPLKGFGKGWGK